MNHWQSEFVIKPYNMSIDDLYKWREKFDKINTKHWKTNPNPPTAGGNITPDKTGYVPRFVRR